LLYNLLYYIDILSSQHLYAIGTARRKGQN